MIAKIIEILSPSTAGSSLIYGVLIVLAVSAIERSDRRASDLSDPQVIVSREWKGQSPTLIETR